MILAIDIGNTNIVIGCCADGQVIFRERVSTNPTATVLEYAAMLKMAFDMNRADITAVDGAILSSVVPAVTLTMRDAVHKYLHLTPLVVGPGIKTGLRIHIDNPAQLGSDLVVDAVAGIHHYPLPQIIIDMGTATKLLVVTKNKEFLGGAICAGIKGSMDSLVTTTSKLSRTSLEVPKKVINGDTSQCIQSGILYGHIAMVEGLVNKAKAEIGDYSTKVIVTGGYSNVIKAYLDSSYIYDANLLLDGMLFIYNKNK